MEIFNFSGPIKTSRPLKPIIQLLLIGIIIVGSVFFIMISILPFLEEFESNKINQGTITKSSAGGLCEAITDDETAPKKLITNCNLEPGTKVSLIYQKGNPFAQISTP